MFLKYVRPLSLVTLLFLGGAQSPVWADLKNPEDLLGSNKDKKKDKDEPPPMERAPVPQPVKLTVNRGDLVEITLRALTASNQDVQFLLRTAPTAGKFIETEPVRKSKTSAVLHYQSDPNSKLAHDEFKFATRIAGGNVSPAETASLTLLEIKPELEVQDKVEMGQVRCGQKVTVTVPIKNVGNGPFTQSVPLPAGWSWGDKWEVPAGKSMNVKLTFAPTTLGPSHHLLSLGVTPKAQLTLDGLGLLPVEIPSVVELKWDPATSQRRAALAVRNVTDAAVSITLTGDAAGLLFPKETALNAHGEATLNLELHAAPARGLRETLTVAVGGLTQPLQVVADAAPAQVVLEGLGEGATLDFGNVDGGKLASIQKTLTLANRGGTSVSLYGNPPESFLLDGYVPSMTLAAGQEVPVLVHFRPDAVGPIHNTVEIRWDKHLLSFHLLAKVIPDPNAKTTVMDAPLNQSANPLEDQDPIQNNDRANIDRDLAIVQGGLMPPGFILDNAIPEVKDITVRSADADSITLGWPALPDPTYDYVVFYREFRIINGYARVLWTRFPQMTVRHEGNDVLARLPGIRPGFQNQLRISALSSAGAHGMPSQARRYARPMANPLDWMKLCYWAVGIFIVVAMYLRRRAQKLAFVPRRYVSRLQGEVAEELQAPAAPTDWKD